MYCNFTAHKPSQNGTSSRNIFDYLDKENQAEKEKDILAWQVGAISLEEVEQKFYHYDNLFNQDFDIEKLDDKKKHISVETASRMIDENRGTQRKTEANFYMMNISPSAQELAHLEKQAETILAERGLRKSDLERTKDPLVIEYYNEQKEQVLKAQLKSYAQDVMNEYARAMNREVYVHQDKLPDDKTRREMLPEIERRYEEYLKTKGIVKENTSHKMVVKYNESRELDNGKIFSIETEPNKNISMFVPNNKIEHFSENTLVLDKAYYDTKVIENEAKEKGLLDEKRRKEFTVTIVETKGDSTLIATKPDNYDNEVRFWVNKSDIQQNENKISMQEYRAKRLIEKAIERDKEQKTKVEITFDKVDVSDIKVKEGQEPDKMYTFYKQEQGLKEPITFTFKESELHKEGDKIFVEKYKLDHRTEKAVENQTKNEYGEVKEKIKDQVWSENGYDTTKRKLEGKDLMWFGKIETERSYSHKDKQVLENREILKQIKELKEQPKPNQKEIEKLEKSLHRDKISNEVIKEGVKKSGNQAHIHIVVSRHDKTSVNPKDKVSMSPLANHKEGTLHNGAKVGFNRDEFFKNQEAIFDKKFGYNRNVEHSYQYQNMLKNEVKGQIEGQVKGKVKQFVKEYTGLSKVRQELNPTSEFRKEFKNIPLPTHFPKTKLEAVKKVVMHLKNLVIDKGQSMGY